jgi:hypothetical protein
LIAADKTTALAAVVDVGVVYIAAVRRLSGRSLIIGALALLLAFSIVGKYRKSIEAYRSPGQSALSASALVHDLSAATHSVSVRGLLLNEPSSVASRLREIDNLTIIRQKTPSLIPYQPTLGLIEGPLIYWIPRITWPGKPVLSTGAAFSESYYGIPASESTLSAVTIPGFLYESGGTVVLFAGMFALGAVIRRVEYLVDWTADPRRLILLGPILTAVLFSENDTTTYLLGLLELSVLGLVVIRYSFRAHNDSSVSSSVNLETNPSSRARKIVRA